MHARTDSTQLEGSSSLGAPESTSLDKSLRWQPQGRTGKTCTLLIIQSQSYQLAEYGAQSISSARARYAPTVGVVNTKLTGR